MAPDRCQALLYSTARIAALVVAEVLRASFFAPPIRIVWLAALRAGRSGAGLRAKRNRVCHFSFFHSGHAVDEKGLTLLTGTWYQVDQG
jgi:hypothetical protein